MGTLSTAEAYEALSAFAGAHGRSPLLLLLHASVPETLRPDLLHLIQINFLAGPADPSHEADVLFAPFTTCLGGDYYRVDAQVRWHGLALLRSLYREEARGREVRVAELLWRHLEALERRQRIHAQTLLADYIEVQRWVALAYLEPSEAARALAQALRDAEAASIAAYGQLGGLAAAMELPLAGEPALLTYAKGLDALVKGDEPRATRLLEALGDQPLQIGDVSLKPPTEWLRRQAAPPGLARQRLAGSETVWGVVEKLAPGVDLPLVEIPSDRFLMGSPPGEEGREVYAQFSEEWKRLLGVEGVDVEAQRLVSVPRFWMGRFPITQAQWQVVAGWPQVERKLKADPARFKGADRPVERVSWHEAVEFCRRLSKRTGRHYSLPSEALWEYACRAGTTTPFHFGPTLSTDLANYDGNYTYASGPKGEYREHTTPVGCFPANAWGLHDMHGNVWEWCLDRWHASPRNGPSDGRPWLEAAEELPPEGRELRLLRGGSWFSRPRNCRSAYRSRKHPADSDGLVGFRVCCLPPGLPSWPLNP